jgi:hypothetical protein
MCEGSGLNVATGDGHGGSRTGSTRPPQTAPLAARDVTKPLASAPVRSASDAILDPPMGLLKLWLTLTICNRVLVLGA